MTKVSSLYAPVVVTVTAAGGAVAPGAVAVIDTNVAARIIYTLDGSLPAEGATGTLAGEAPVSVLIAASCTLRFRATDSARPFNYSKLHVVSFQVTRQNPLELFRDGKHFYNSLRSRIVDENFYPWVSGWAVPKSDFPYTFLFKNVETIRSRTRVIHNGRDTRTSGFPVLDPNQAAEFTMFMRATDNMIEIQTEETIGT